VDLQTPAETAAASIERQNLLRELGDSPQTEERARQRGRKLQTALDAAREYTIGVMEHTGEREAEEYDRSPPAAMGQGEGATYFGGFR